MVKPETRTPLVEPTNDSAKKEKHVTLIQSPSLTSISQDVSKNTDNLVPGQSDVRKEDHNNVHLGIFEQTIESLNEKRGVTQEKTRLELEIQDKKENMMRWEKLSLKCCCGHSTTYAVSILAPMELTVMILCLFTSIALLNAKFLTVDELKNHHVLRTIDSIHRTYVFDVHDYTDVDRQARKHGILVHINMSERAINVLNGCGANYVYDIHPYAKRKELSQWITILMLGFILRIIATVPLFFIRKSDIQESLEGRRLCVIYFVMQPFGLIFVLVGALNIFLSKTLCELDYLVGKCCLRAGFIYFGVAWTIFFKIPELTILLLHWKALSDQMERSRQFRKAIALQKKQRAEDNKCKLFPSVSYFGRNDRNLGSSNDGFTSSSTANRRNTHTSKHRSSSKVKAPVPIDITRMSSFVDPEKRRRRDSFVSDVSVDVER